MCSVSLAWTSTPLPAGIINSNLVTTPLGLLLYFTDPTLPSTTPIIYISTIGVADPAVYSNSRFEVVKSHPVTLLAPSIMTDATPIAQIDYFIEDPALTTTALPPVAYGNSVTATDANLATDGRLTVQY